MTPEEIETAVEAVLKAHVAKHGPFLCALEVSLRAKEVREDLLRARDPIRDGLSPTEAEYLAGPVLGLVVLDSDPGYVGQELIIHG